MSELRFGDVERLSKNETEARFRPLGDGSNRASSHESDFSPALSDGFLLVPELDAFPIYAVRALSERSGARKAGSECQGEKLARAVPAPRAVAVAVGNGAACGVLSTGYRSMDADVRG